MIRPLTVARREYLERVRSKAFLVSTVIGPMVMAAFFIIPALMMTNQRGKPLRVAVLDATGKLKQPVEEALARRTTDDGIKRFIVEPAPAGAPAEARSQVHDSVLKGGLDGYVDLPADALEKSSANYYAKNLGNFMDLSLMRKALDEAFVAERLTSQGLDPRRVRDVTRELDLKTVRVSGRGEREDRGASFLLSLFLLAILYTTLSIWGAAIMNGVIEEKNNRVVEVVVSSIPAWALFAGKLIGVGGAGLTQFAVWVGTLTLFSVYGAAMGATRVPEMPPLLLASFALFFLLGYFLYGSLYAAIGASVNTTQEAQSLAFPVMAPLMLSFVFYPAVLASPDSTFSVVLSLVPFFAPLLMFLRISAVPPPAWQIVLCIVLLLAAIAGVTWAASRVYRVGILMYGKRPTLPEILKWVRAA